MVIEWGDLEHAYGKALDTPELLRQAASPDEEVAEAAVSELYGSIFHQGTVYPATVAAVPVLAGLARTAPHGRAGLVWMLGQLADPQHAYGRSFPAVRAAVAAQAPELQALLDDDQAGVREAAAYAVARAAPDAAVLWQRWHGEGQAPVRASLALALGVADPAGAGPVLAEAVLRDAPPVRVAAAMALLRAGREWPAGAVDAIVTALDDGAELEYCWAHSPDWTDELLPGAPDPLALLDRWLRATRPATRGTALWAASQWCDESRSAPVRVVPLVAAAMQDPDPSVREKAVVALAHLGAAAQPYADDLAQLAADYPAVADATAYTVQYHAVGALARLGDPRWVEPVCVAAAAGHRGFRLLDGARRTPAALAAVRAWLAAEPQRADVLAAVLGEWCAEQAVPELIAALPHAGPPVAAALVRLGHDLPEAEPILRDQASNGDTAAALAVWRLTGDSAPVLQALDRGGHRYGGSMAFVGQLGEALRPLLPAAREQLTGEAAPIFPHREIQILSARVVAAFDGVPAVLPTVRAVLSEGDTPARAAADLIADLAVDARADLPVDAGVDVGGAAGAVLGGAVVGGAAGAVVGGDGWSQLAGCVPLLRERLGDRWCRVAAARALARLGVPVDELTEPLVEGVTDYAGRFGLAAIRELRATATIPHLRELLATDRRLQASSDADRLVWSDERLQQQIRETINELTAIP
ncbi:hypothetical protein [Actinoplanes sp. N902-109]|uniref:hypothetical protein n=1 Tax=Actinoplanes sp. (strain N902-109) TaxID=649831 RepID=UPI000684B281|nr:hypothetical protein [Actinoplanes sp. N902-109]